MTDSRKHVDPALDATVTASALEDTALGGPAPGVGSGSSGVDSAVTGASAPALPAVRAVLVAIAAVAAVNIGYFVVRFVVSSDAPALHPAFRGVSAPAGDAGTFSEMLGALGGPRTTLVRLVLVSTILLVLPLVIAARHRRNLLAQQFAAVCVLGGQLSLAVTVLTSQETSPLWRGLAAALYVLLPALTLTTLALFPTGRPVPRWSVRIVPLAWAPFAVQAWVMYTTRGYSRPTAMAGIAAGMVFLGFQWYRYRRRATLRQRHQIKWFAYGAVAFLAIQGVAIMLVLPLLDDRASAARPLFKLLYEVLLGASYLVGLVIALLAAVRYRLWEIDRIINRTIVYSVLTVVLALFFGVGYFAVRAALYETLHASGTVAAVASFGAVAAAFGPCRRWIIRWTDRRIYGIRIDYEALAVRAHAGAPPASGSTFAAYDELELLGRGGMGAVYRAHDAERQVPVALKVMSRDLAGDPAAEERFRREAQILEGVKHPNVVRFLASGHSEGLAFIAMELVDGEDLHSICKRRERLTAGETVALLGGVAQALDASHALGVVHRDVKPANILVAGDDSTPLHQRRPLLMDFGIASWPEAEPAATDANRLIGSLRYIAPEQIRGAADVDGRADVYSLGITAYELLTGRPPFRNDSALGLIMAHLNQPPPDPRAFADGIPEPTATAVLRALAKQPADRFATAADFITAATPASA